VMIKKSYAQGSIPNRSHFQVTLNFKSLGTLGGGDSGVNYMPGVQFWTGRTFRYHLIKGDQGLLRYQFQEQLNERRSAWDSWGTTFGYNLILRDWGLLMDVEPRTIWMAGLFCHFFFLNDCITGAHNRRKRNLLVGVGMGLPSTGQSPYSSLRWAALLLVNGRKPYSFF